MLYRILKNIIEKGLIDEEAMLEKLSFFRHCGSITVEEEEKLLSVLAEN